MIERERDRERKKDRESTKDLFKYYAHQYYVIDNLKGQDIMRF